MSKRRRYWKNADRLLSGSVASLIVFGLVAVSSASAVLSYQRFGHTNYYLFRQLLFAAIGFILIYVFSKIDFHVWRKWNKPIILGAIVVLAAVLIPGIGFSSGGSRSWFSLGPFLIQPSEFAKLALIFYLASWFERKPGAPENFWFGIVPPLLVLGILLGLVVVQPDLGTASVFGVVIVAMLFAAGSRIKYLIGLGAAAMFALWILIKSSPYRAARIVTFLDPSLDPRGIGYHINQALLAVGSGGLLGYGFGASRQKHNYLPEPIGDSIFAVMAEELGFARIIIFVLLFLLIGYAGMRLARGAPDKFGQILATGITSWIILQAFLNIGAIIGILPLTGITLPFVSYGGSSFLALSVGVGILLNLSRQREA